MDVIFDTQRSGGDAVFDTQQSSGLTVSAGVGGAIAAGVAATIFLGAIVSATVGAAAAAGSTASINGGQTINALTGNATAAGASANITASGAQTITATVGGAAAAGLLATIGRGVLLQALVGAASAAGAAAAITNGNVLLVLQPGRRVVARQAATLITVDAMDVEESDVLAFDFEKALPTGVTLLDAVIAVDRRSGSEATPANFAVGARQLASNDLQVLQQLDASLVEPGNYAVRCKASRSDGLRSVAVALVTVARL